MITKEELKELNVSMTSFARDLAVYLDEDYTNAFYQHIGRVLNGEVEPTPQETQASEKWLHVHNNAHEIGRKYFEFIGLRRTVESLRKVMRSGIHNPTHTERAFDKILKLLR